MKAARSFLALGICSMLLVTACSKSAADKVAWEEQVMQDMAYGPHAQHQNGYLPARKQDGCYTAYPVSPWRWIRSRRQS